MASTINASNSGSGGLISTGDASGVLQLQTASTAALTIDASQNSTFAGSVKTNTLTSASATALTLQSAGTTAITVDTSQRVGIGGTPVKTLSILPTSIRRMDFYVRDPGVDDSLVIRSQNATNNNIRDMILEGSFLRFFTGADSGGSGSERMRIDSSGNVGIGTTSPTVKLFVAASDTGPRIAVDQTADNAADMITFRRNGSERGKIYISDSATVYQTSSDYRLKKNITPLTGSLETVAKLKPSSFTWVQERGGQQDTGFIAHELAEVMPQAVTGEKDATREEQYEVTPAVKDEEGNITTPAVMGTRTVPSYQGIDTSFLVATLTAALQETKALIDTQAETINALTARIVALEQA